MSTITVTDQTGKRVDKNNATVAEGNKKLQIDLEDVGSGRYTVEWKALATDQHTMKRKSLLLILTVIGLALVVLVLLRTNQTPTQRKRPSTPAATPQDMPATAKVPAHYEIAPAFNSLAVTLPPDRFSGKAREAYQVVREIPQLIAQMPCYCHCDRSLGHKSLHSCFEDNHAANCATCIQEALTAYALQKQGLSAEKIRERIIAELSDAE